MKQETIRQTNELIEIGEELEISGAIMGIYFAVVVVAYLLSVWLAPNSYLQMALPTVATAVWVFSLLIYQAHLHAEGNKFDFEGLQFDNERLRLEEAALRSQVAEMQPLANELQSAQLELRTVREKLQSVEALAQSQTNRAVELDRLLESEKQSRANEKAIVLEELANANKQLTTAKAIAMDAQATAVANAKASMRLEYAPAVKVAQAYVEYTSARSIVNTPTSTAEEKAEGSRAMKAAKETLDKFVLANAPKQATV